MQHDPSEWVAAVRRSHDRLSSLVSGLDRASVEHGSFCGDWSIAQVLSHLGSQAEIFGLFVDAGLTGAEAPGPDAFGPIWDRWNALPPEAQVAQSTAANEAFVRRMEALGSDQLAALRLRAFGTELDAAGVLRMRLSEHALHTWDVAVALDRSATVAPDAVELLIDGLPDMAGRAGTAAAAPRTVELVTSAPERRFALNLGGVSLQPWEGQPTDGTVRLGAEQLVRLVYGRLQESEDAQVRVDAEGIGPADLRATFPGF